MKTAHARNNTKLGWTVAENPKKLKVSDMKVLLGLLFLIVGIVSMVLGHLGNYPTKSSVFWIVAGLVLVLNGFGILSRKRPPF
jgi:hypothetical protein